MPKIEITILVQHENDGRKFDIDRILDIRRAASTKYGGVGIRYICRVCGREIRIFDEEGKWFIEK